MASILMNNFNALKNKGMTDDAAMKEAMRLTTKSRAKQRKADTEARKKPGWVEKLKMASTKHIAKKYHSKAGKEHLAKKKAGV